MNIGQLSSLILPVKRVQISPLSKLLLGGLCGITMASGLFAIYGLFGSLENDNSLTVTDWRPPTLTIVPLDPPKAADIEAEALKRPIFSKDRRPAAKAPAPLLATNATDGPTDLYVIAIIQRLKLMKAFLVSSATPEGSWQTVGDTVGAWTVTAISPMEVTLRNDNEIRKLRLYTEASFAPDASEIGKSPNSQR